MRVSFLVLLAAFLITSSFTLKRNNTTIENTNLSLQQDSVKIKLSLLKKLSEALKFRKHAHEKEKKRVINIIDALIRDSALISGQQLKHSEFDINLIKTRLDLLQIAVEEMKWDKEDPIPPVNPIPNPPNPPITPEHVRPAPDQEEINNEKYIEDLLKALSGKESPPDEAGITAKQERLALIRGLILKPTVFKDTVNNVEREHTVKLRQAAEVWGFYPYTSRELNLNYRVFSTIVIDAYELNGNTGRSMKDLELKNAEVSRRAKVMNSKLIMGVTSDAANTNKFLQSSFAQNQFSSQIVSVLIENNMDGLNIRFSDVNSKVSLQMLSFINNLSRELRKGKKKFTLSLTIPDFDIKLGYDISALSEFTDRFLVDFSQQNSPDRPGPLAPLKQQSDYSIETCVSRYLATPNVAPSKFVLLLPYYGMKRSIDKAGKGKNPTLLSYSQIRSKYQFHPLTYDEQTATAIIEIVDTAGVVNEKIWFDNENTLGKKYDFVLKNNLAGVAIRDMVADAGYGELADELAYKFLLPDTSITRSTDLNHQEFGWAYIKKNIKEYLFVLGNPCDSAHSFVDRTLLTYINIILTVICLILGLLYYSKIKAEGEDWAYKKPMLIVTGIMTFTLITCGFAWIYLDSDIPWFGVDKECINMPFLILYMIILAGIALGILLMRFLLFPIVRQEDTP